MVAIPVQISHARAWELKLFPPVWREGATVPLRHGEGGVALWHEGAQATLAARPVALKTLIRLSAGQGKLWPPVAWRTVRKRSRLRIASACWSGAPSRGRRVSPHSIPSSRR